MIPKLAARLVKAVWAPFAVWVLASALLIVVAQATGFNPLAADTWARGDSKHYLGIAADGYDLAPCDATTEVMCGDAAWFPAFAWVLGAIARLGFDALPTGVVVAWLFSLATLVLLWHTFLRALPIRERFAPILLAAFVPGQVYHRAVFPLSMLAFFSLLHLWLLSRRRFAAAGMSGAVAGATYPLGVLLVPISAGFAAVADPSAGRTERWRRAALTAGLASIGPLAVVTVMKLQTGSWTAFFQIQEKYAHGIHFPLESLHGAVEPLFEGPLFDLGNFRSIQTAFVAAAVLLLVAWSLADRRRFTRVDWLLLAVTVVTWALPLTQANVSLYRSEAALVPAVVLLRKVPRTAAVAVVAAAIVISVAMEVLFLQRRLL